MSASYQNNLKRKREDVEEQDGSTAAAAASATTLMDILSANAVDQLKALKNSQQKTLRLDQGLNLLIINVKKYLIDAHFKFNTYYDALEAYNDRYPRDSSTRGDLATFVHAYELLLTDGVSAQFCLLHPSLNHLLEKWDMSSLSSRAESKECSDSDLFRVISLKQCRYLIDETVPGGDHGFIYIEEMDHVIAEDGMLYILSNVCSDGQYLFDLFKKFKKEIESSHSPLATKRRCWWPLYDDDNFLEENAHLKKELPLYNDEERVTSKYLARALDNNDKSRTLFVRVLKKSKIAHFGKATDQSHLRNIPLYAILVVADDSTPSGVPCYLWNAACLAYYGSINVGDVISIKGYKIKPFSRKSVMVKDFGEHRFELSLDFRYCKISRVAGANRMARISLPLKSSLDIAYMQEDSIINAGGYVVNTTRPSRIRRPRQFEEDLLDDADLGSYSDQTSKPDTFYQYRTITLLDGYGIAITCVLFTNSRQSAVESIQIGYIVILQNVRLRSLVTGSRVRDRWMRADSTYATTMFLERDMLQDGEIKDSFLRMFEDDGDSVRDALQDIIATRDERANVFMDHGVALPQLPCPIQTLGMLQDMYPRHADLSFFHSILSEGKYLLYSEEKTFVIQTRIIDVVYVRSNDGASDGYERHRKQARTTGPLSIRFKLQDLNGMYSLNADHPIWPLFLPRVGKPRLLDDNLAIATNLFELTYYIMTENDKKHYQENIRKESNMTTILDFFRYVTRSHGNGVVVAVVRVSNVGALETASLYPELQILLQHILPVV